LTAAKAGGWSVPFIRRVRAKNFRSIAECDVTLGPLTVLLGFNASGKSNFLDLLRFTRDALTTSVAAAVSSRGGLDAILYKSAAGRAESFEIHLACDLDQARHFTYRFVVGGGAGRGYVLRLRGERPRSTRRLLATHPSACPAVQGTACDCPCSRTPAHRRGSSTKGSR
jgi:predicted ATPase